MSLLWLAFASILFYGYWNPKFVIVLLGSILVNYNAGNLIATAKIDRKKILLIIFIIFNLSLLGVFKYANFFISSANAIGFKYNYIDIVLPLGISFFTFTQIAYLVDVYRKISIERNFIHYLLFVTWFPHLIAGPVLHHKQMMPQFANKETSKLIYQSIAAGLTLFSFGLFKKVIFAEQYARYSTPLFNANITEYPPMFIGAWTAGISFALQIYFDFSGYSDMALGISKMFGIKLPLNFNSPYKASSIIDFWRRWHISLSIFLKNYLYIPLGGNRKGVSIRYYNILITMLLGGLWHGAGWNFVLWGGLHGTYLIINHFWSDLKHFRLKYYFRFNHAFSVVLTFLCVVVAWIPFRATNINSTYALWRGMFGFNGISFAESLSVKYKFLNISSLQFNGFIPGSSISFPETVAWLFVGLIVVWFFPNTQRLLSHYDITCDELPQPQSNIWPLTPLYGIITGLILFIAIISINKVSEFLYFQF
ncbi:MAG: MBOAT family O-acyltransferase [bacterium]